MKCAICETNHQPEQMQLVHLDDEGRRARVCHPCVSAAVERMLFDVAQAEAMFCRGCPQKVGGGCLRGVTPETCG